MNHTPRSPLSRRELVRRSADAGALVALGGCGVIGDALVGMAAPEAVGVHGLPSAQARAGSSEVGFYVDSVRGDDSDIGTTPQTPWQSLARLEQAVQAGEIGAGDTVWFVGGSSFARNQASEGSFWFEEGIRYEGLGSGDKPRFVGSGDRPFGIRGLGTSLAHMSFIGGARSVLHTDGAAPVQIDLQEVDCLGGDEIGFQQLSGAGVSAGSSFVIVGGSFSDNGSIGINITGARETRVEGVTAARNGTVGIRLQSSGPECVIRGCLAHENGANGIGVDTPRSGGGGEVVEGNTVHSNARTLNDRSGIKTFSAGTVIRYNEVYDNGEAGTLNHGIQLETGSRDCLCYGNISRGNPTAGVSFTGSGHQIFHNTCHDNGESGIATFSTSVSDCRVKNNLLADNGRYSFRSHGSVSTSGLQVDYNLHERDGSAAVVRFVGIDYPTLAALEAAHGLEVHGVEGGARLSQRSRVPPPSSAVGSGDPSVGIATDFDGNTYGNPPTIGAFEVQKGR